MICRKYGGMRGFTVVEIIIIIVVLAILATIGTLAYAGVQRNLARATLMSSLTEIQKKMSIEYVRTRTVTGELPQPPDKVTFTRVQDDVVHYSGLSDVQNGVLFHSVCLELIADPAFSVIHARSGGGTSSVVMRCDDSVNVDSILITGWDSRTWTVPINQATIESYMAGVPYDSWWTDRQDVIRGFYTELISRFSARGGSWPIRSFWHPWAAPGNSGVPRQALPEPDSPAEGVFCVQAVHANYPDMVFSVSQEDSAPHEGTCN